MLLLLYGFALNALSPGALAGLGAPCPVWGVLGRHAVHVWMGVSF